MSNEDKTKQQDTYDFSVELQREILAMLLIYEKEIIIFKDIVSPLYFENPCQNLICETIFEFFEKYSRAPSKDELTEESINNIAKKDPNLIDVAGDELSQLFSIIEHKDDYEYLKDKVISFAKFQAMKFAIIEGAKLLKTRRDYQGVRQRIEDALMVGESREDLGTFYLQDLEKRLALRKGGDTRRAMAIGTGFKKLDDGLYGGIAPGEVGIILGPSKRGKTATLVNFAVGHLLQGKSVVHFALEGMEGSLTDRYDSKISGIPIDNLAEREEEVRNAVDYFKGCCGMGQLLIKKFPAHATSPATIEAHLRRLTIMEKFNPDVVMVDYLGLLISSSKSLFSADSSGRYLMLGQITKDLISIAQRYGYAFWIAHQGTRDSKNKELVEMDDAADSFEPMRDADLILTLNQTPDEADRFPIEYRIHVAGGRSVPDKGTFGFYFDPSRMQLVENESFVDLRGKAREETKKKKEKT
jgi:replicative DNA helicase